MAASFKRWLVGLINKWSSSPDESKVHKALDELLKDTCNSESKRGLAIPCDPESKWVIVSDQHKGGGDRADDFLPAVPAYLKALDYYYQNGFTLINNGDAEELWESNLKKVLSVHHESLLAEKKFYAAGRYYRLFGNHDEEYAVKNATRQTLDELMGGKLWFYEALLLQFPDQQYFIAHGHQGDIRSDGNPFSKWVVANIWSPIQRLLKISINSLSDSLDNISLHNEIMYRWSAQQQVGMNLVAGHTHQPIFQSLTHFDQLIIRLEKVTTEEDRKHIESELHRIRNQFPKDYQPRRPQKPTYYNSGCCCFDDGDITCLEITASGVKLVKWKEGRVELAGNEEIQRKNKGRNRG
ncbi:MAG: metallophosphoesterase [Chitinophagaceae bacterium]|nr:metallophosphoesterase [Chitinophagaceae bacterium]